MQERHWHSGWERIRQKIKKLGVIHQGKINQRGFLGWEFTVGEFDRGNLQGDFTWRNIVDICLDVGRHL